MSMTKQAKLMTKQPLSTALLLVAFGAGMLGYTNLGWLLFGAGAIAWIKLDARKLKTAVMGVHGLTPALALLAYQTLAGDQAEIAITFALALHALVVFLILLSRQVAEDTPHLFSHQKGISRSI
jgi:hypothetical protein